MLGAIRDFIFTWQFIPLGVFIIGWVWGGGWLILRSLKKHQYPGKIRLGNCMVASFLAGMGGSVVAMAFIYLFKVIGPLLEARPLVILAAGAVPAAAVATITAYLVIYAMLDLSMRRALRIAAGPILAVLLLGTIIAAPTGIVTLKQRRARQHKNWCLKRVLYLTGELRTYQRRTGRPAQNLQALIEQNLVAQADLRCPAAPEKKIAYFYMPARLISPDEPSHRILLCDFHDNHTDGRSVAFSNGTVIWYEEHEFQSLLAQHQDTDFAASLRAAEGR